MHLLVLLLSLHLAGVPEGGILSGQSTADNVPIIITVKASDVRAIACPMWPVSWHWKHLSFITGHGIH